MDQLKINREELSPMRVAYVSVNSLHPEEEALDKILAWAEKKNLLKNPDSYRLFGYDSCLPYPDHVYTALITVTPAVEPDDEIQIKTIPGGVYGVVSVRGVENIGKTWDQIEAWAEDSEYQLDQLQWLEEYLSPQDTPPEDIRVNLLFPLAR